MSSYAVEISNLTYGYTSDELVLDVPVWRVAEASATFLRGPSGAGKSTLLNIICGLSVPQAGQVVVCGEDVYALKGGRRDRFRAQKLGVVYQRFNLLNYLTVKDNLRLAMWCAEYRRAKDPRELLEQLGLSAVLMSRKVATLSVGQQQRVAIARALINRPSLLIADEPTSALDPNAASAFVSLLLEQAAIDGTTVIFASHDTSLMHQFDSVISLHELQPPHASRRAYAA